MPAARAPGPHPLCPYHWAEAGAAVAKKAESGECGRCSAEKPFQTHMELHEVFTPDS
jgi:hypothetical protein